jgi:hypothetical protein
MLQKKKVFQLVELCLLMALKLGQVVKEQQLQLTRMKFKMEIISQFK